ncbi:hypothetical protein [Burkholderia plantarii]|uniref:Uncharacterized protein n=1 Tax=Burkholderia plantarii TaxID=41899 RepID=A0A0B6RWI3_BURPL|nr:hypothetical protein [Burkholderia plantarii]AJK45385.1 hypothetical protein BGL_1c08520 [Burkholderia plantarii]
MADLQLPREAALIASSAADQFARLEAMFDAIRAYLPEGMYEHALAGIGQCVASHYATNMRGLSRSEVRHD